MTGIGSWRRAWSGVDWRLLTAWVSLQIIGLLALASATYSSDISRFVRQVVWLAIAIIVHWLAFRSDLNQWLRWSPLLYKFNIALLVLVLIVGEERYGAQRWLRVGPLALQPSEFAKPLLIISLASFFSQRAGASGDWSLLIRSAVYVTVPFLLIFWQPDFGTALVLAAIWLGMLFIAGIAVPILLSTVLAGILLFSVAWQKGIIKDYQKNRLTAFIDPYSRANREGYHILQAQLAIGSGGLTGTGLFKGRMGKLGFVPAQHTDFIFTVISEETGFVGSSVTVLLFLLLLSRLLVALNRTGDPFAAFILAGTFFYFAAHFFINVGMNLRLMPITGLPLPFLSAGGSNLVNSHFLLGLTQMIVARPKRFSSAA